LQLSQIAPKAATTQIAKARGLHAAQPEEFELARKELAAARIAKPAALQETAAEKNHPQPRIPVDGSTNSLEKGLGIARGNPSLEENHNQTPSVG
jgi:hypothetical protein